MSHGVGEKEIGAAVVIVIAPGAADGGPDGFEPCLFGDLSERAVAVVVEEPVGCFAIEETTEVIGDAEIEQAIAIVIDPGGAEARTPDAEARFFGDVREGAVAVVAQQVAFAAIEAETGHVEIDEAVIVVIARRDGEGVDGSIEAGTNGDVGKSAVAVVAIEAGATVGRRDHDIEGAIIVVIEDGDAAAGTGFVEADPGCDVGEFDYGFFVTGGYFHSEFFGNESGVAAHLAGCQPEPVTGSFVFGVGAHGLDTEERRTLEFTGA